MMTQECLLVIQWNSKVVVACQEHMTTSILCFLVQKPSEDLFREPSPNNTRTENTTVVSTTTTLNTQICHSAPPDILYEAAPFKYTRKHLGRRKKPTVHISQYQLKKGGEPIKPYPTTKLTREEKKEVLMTAWNNGKPYMAKEVLEIFQVNKPEIAAKLNIRTIQRWILRAKKLQNNPSNEEVSKPRGRPKKVPNEVYKKIVTEIKTTAKAGGAISPQIAQSLANAMIQKEFPIGIPESVVPTYSQSWVRKVLNKEKLVRRKQTHTAQKVPENAIQIIDKMVLYTAAIVSEYNIPPRKRSKDSNCHWSKGQASNYSSSSYLCKWQFCCYTTHFCGKNRKIYSQPSQLPLKLNQKNLKNCRSGFVCLTVGPDINRMNFDNGWRKHIQIVVLCIFHQVVHHLHNHVI